MKLPRDLSGTEVARRLARHYGYRAMTDNPSAETRARPAEIIFEVTEAVEGGYNARALVIYTQGENWDDLKEMARDAVLCHFDEDAAPRP